MNEYMRDLSGKMFTFEVTKCCGYSTFVCMYKDETMIDLYNRVSHHFCLHYINKLFYRTPAGEDISIPISGLVTIRSFINDNICCSPAKIAPIYDLPHPVVYKIYLDDGHIHNDTCRYYS